MSDSNAGADFSPPAPVVSLDEFCAALSGQGFGPEPIAGWAHGMTAEKRTHDTPAAYRASFDAWLSAPAG